MKTLNKILIIYIIIIIDINVKSQWTHEFSLYQTLIFYLNTVDTNIVWAIGEKYDATPVIFTRYGYNNWYWYDNTNLPISPQLYSSVAGINSSTGFVGSLTGKIYKTTDYSVNWTQVLDAGTRWVVDIKFSKVNKNTGYIFCSPQYTAENFIVYRTTNYGNTWQTFTLYFYNSLSANKPSVWVTDSAHAWCGLSCITLHNCAGPKIAYTTNGGINWHTTGFVDGNRTGINTLAFKTDNQIGLAATYRFTEPINIWKTTNGGLNWTFLHSFTISHNPVIINIPGTSVWYLGGSTPNNPGRVFIYKSSDDGTSWTQMTTDDSTYDILCDMDGIAIDGKIYAWAIVHGGENYHQPMKILMIRDTVSVIGINGQESIIPKKFKLEQNCPNPFNPTTKISYALPKACNVKIIIYNMVGQVLKMIVNEYKDAGYYDISFDGSNLASGLYIYKIETPYFIDSKKMILIK